MNSITIRKKFHKFFEDKDHKIVPSAPIVVQNDPTLMFTNAGMNQFKDFFLGNQIPVDRRVADTQKCLRVSGKHNDLDEVGHDTYHHTMFEMLGNWSFGDYFKQEAVAMAWELLTKEFELPEDRMYATVFEGSSEESLDPDSEALTIWKEYLPESRILFGNKQDNFWEMGETGPCGPCSEIHIDLRSKEEIAKTSGRDLVNKDHPQVVEIWNLVFMQFNRLKDGSLQNLPEKHVDTGMGFERLVMAIQKKRSNYDTDVFQPLIKEVGKKASITYGDDEKQDIALRVISDHIRAISFTIADGQLPANNKAGYVIRRILRRAVRYGYTFLGLHEPFLFDLVELLSDQFKETFPELNAQKDFVKKVIKEEEISFLRTLDKGLKKLDQLKDQRMKEIPGSIVFELYDTYGFPFDLTALIAFENDMTVDEIGFREAMSEQKTRSKSDAKQETDDWVEVVKDADHSKFLGYEQLESQASIVRYRQVSQKGKTLYQLVLDQTPFYAESGGQVGDTGVLLSGESKVAVIDTKKENELIVHVCPKLPSDINQKVTAQVNNERRSATESNHSATHLVHAALRQVLGDHVQQRGSLVNEKLLRFDFSHFSKLTNEEIRKVEKIVNEKIRENIALDEQRDVAISEARDLGAMALFGEKYGDFVRVITFDESYSVELCGGTHVKNTGQIGFFKIVSEASVAAGVRRIEGVTGRAGEELVFSQMDQLDHISELLKHPQDTLKALNSLLDERQELKRQVDELQVEKVAAIKTSLQDKIENFDGFKMLVVRESFPDSDGLKSVAFQLKQEHSGLIQLIGADIGGKPQLSVMIDEDLVKTKTLNASTLVRDMAKSIKGGGGGQPFYATAGGKDVNGLDAALEHGKQVVLDALNS